MARNPMKKRKKTVRGAASRRSERRPQTRPAASQWEDELSEFSDDTNSFYVDEVEERERRTREYADDYGDLDYHYQEYDDLYDRDDHRDGSWDADDRERERRAGRAPQKSRNGRSVKKKQPAKKKKKPQKPAALKTAELKKKEKRKPLSPIQRKIIRIISYAAIIAVVLIVGVVLSLTVLFKAQAYEVTGVTKYSEEEIIDACGINKGENIFLAPKTPAENRVKKAFPYVEEADVGFKIPDTITISVVEAVEGYLVKLDKTDYLVISTKGRILDQVSDPSAYDLPIFIGPTLTSGEIGDYVSYEDDKVVSMIESITQTFADNGYTGITEIDATNMADISFTYDNRIKVKLGIPEDLDYKVRTAMTIINENLDKNQTGSITGVLDVSRCNSTKRSYFDEKAIAPTEVNPSEKPTEASADGGDYSDEWSGDSYTEDDYSFYGNDGSLYTGEDSYVNYGGYDGDLNYE